jgi:hypothetical protein
MSTTKLDALFKTTKPVAEVKTKPLMNDRNKEFSKELFDFIILSQETEKRVQWFKDQINSLDRDELYRLYTKRMLFNYREQSKVVSKIDKLVAPYVKMGKIVYDCKGVTDSTMSLYLTVALILDCGKGGKDG